MKKLDCLLAIIILAIGAAISIAASDGFATTPGENIIVKVDGKALYSFVLSENGQYDVETSYGTNRIIIQDNQVYISEADCDGNDCIAMGHISKSGERIVCLPHRLEIYIEGGNLSVDTVAY